MKGKIRKNLDIAFFYLKQLYTHLLFAVAITGFFIIVGYSAVFIEPELSRTLFDEFVSSLNLVEGMSSFDLFLKIFSNNSLAIFIAIVGGFLFGILPVYVLVANGLVIGIFLNLFLIELSPLVFLVGIMPHGVIEIPVLLLASAVGLLAGQRSLKWLIWGRKFDFIKALKDALLVFAILLIPLLVASFIESFITPWLLSLVV